MPPARAGLAFAALLFEIVEQELQLRDGGVELLGGAAELQPLQPGDLRLQLLDLGRGREQPSASGA